MKHLYPHCPHGAPSLLKNHMFHKKATFYLLDTLQEPF